MSKVRSEYIKKLINESNNLEDKLKEVAESTINTILEEKTNKNLRQILSEDTDEFSEEEVDEPIEGEDGVEGEFEKRIGHDDEGNEIEELLAKFKNENGEFDLSGLDGDEFVKLIKSFSPDDDIEEKEPDDEYEFDDEEEEDDEDPDEVEFEIEKEEDPDEEDYEEEDEDEMEEEPVVELELDESIFEEDFDNEFDDELEDEEGLYEANLGYTDNYQNKTAMTTPPNNEPGKNVRTWDAGVPKGTEKPWVGPKKKDPYNDEVNEEVIYEVDLGECGIEECGLGGGCCSNGMCEIDDEDPLDNWDLVSGDTGAYAGDEEDYEDLEPLDEGGHTVTQNGTYSHGTGKYISHGQKSYRNASKYGKKIKSTGEGYTGVDSVDESIRRQANQIFDENRQMKALVPKLKQQIEEAIVVNQSLANVMKLVTENATTLDEKKEILKRFNECTTKEESNKLYQVISEELKRSGKTYQNLNEAFNSQLAESRSRAVETPMYQSPDLTNTLNFMARLDAIK